ncbi:MAG: MFS transporter [Bacteriovoracaceae bacterium]|nr:MFS transporter [Bacteriovoracaceae bacterium]
MKNNLPNNESPKIPQTPWRVLISIAALGIASGIPLGVVTSLLQAWMTDAGINLKLIGMAALVQLPYTLKFVWSPAVDLVKMNFFHFGPRRSWMLIAQVGLFLSTFSLAFMDPQIEISLLLIMCTAISFFGATHDITIDAFRRDVLEDKDLGMGSAFATNSYLIGFRFLATVLGLSLADALGWKTVIMIMACFSLIGVLGTILAPKVQSLTKKSVSIKTAIWDPFVNFLSKKGALEILLFILLFKVGDNIAGNLMTPFYLKIGFTKVEVAWVGKMIGFWCMLAGGFLGGWMMSKMSIYRALIIFGILQSISTLLFAILETTGPSIAALAPIVGFENLTAGMGSAGFAAFMLKLCDRQFTATQYALLTSFMGIPRVIIPATAGFMAETLGWSGFFTFCALIAIPGVLMILWRSRHWYEAK